MNGGCSVQLPCLNTRGNQVVLFLWQFNRATEHHYLQEVAMSDYRRVSPLLGDVIPKKMPLWIFTECSNGFCSNLYFPCSSWLLVLYYYCYIYINWWVLVAFLVAMFYPVWGDSLQNNWQLDPARVARHGGMDLRRAKHPAGRRRLGEKAGDFQDHQKSHALRRSIHK